MALFNRRKTVFVDSDVLVIGGGMAGCGATYESRLSLLLIPSGAASLVFRRDGFVRAKRLEPGRAVQ